jgi:hypothetical protein
MERRMVLLSDWQNWMSSLARHGLVAALQGPEEDDPNSISGQRRSWVPSKVVQLSPALAKLSEVGFLMT